MFDFLFDCVRVNTNVDGVAYLRTTGVRVGTDAVDFSLPFRPLRQMGYITINIADAIPEGTTGTLPVRFSMGGTPRNLTFFGGANVTAADLAGTGVITVFRDWYSGTLQITSMAAPAAATTNS